MQWEQCVGLIDWLLAMRCFPRSLHLESAMHICRSRVAQLLVLKEKG